jgi:hypothetical protein
VYYAKTLTKEKIQEFSISEQACGCKEKLMRNGLIAFSGKRFREDQKGLSIVSKNES